MDISEVNMDGCIQDFTYMVKFANGDTFHWIEEKDPGSEQGLPEDWGQSFDDEEKAEPQAQAIIKKYKAVGQAFDDKAYDDQMIKQATDSGMTRGEAEDKDMVFNKREIVEVGVWQTTDEDHEKAVIILTDDEVEFEEPTDADRGITEPLDLLESVVTVYEAMLNEAEEKYDEDDAKIVIAKAQVNAVKYAYKYVGAGGTLPNLPW